MMQILTTKSLLVRRDESQLVDEFYKQKFYFSYSSLNRLLWNPALFYQEYILKDKETRTDRHLLEGKAIHALLLSEQHFDKQFIVSPQLFPTPNTKTVLDRVFKKYFPGNRSTSASDVLADYRSEILLLLQSMNLHQALTDDKPSRAKGSTKTGDDKRMEKILTPEAITYWEFLHKKAGRDLIDPQILMDSREIVDKIQRRDDIMTLMGLGSTSSDIEVYNEEAIFYDLLDYSFGIKGVIDNLVIDHGQKQIRINDVKTTGDDLTAFVSNVEYYRYWLQAVIYTLLVCRYFSDYSLDGYTLSFHFVVVDRNKNIYPFPVTESTLERWIDRFKRECLFRANYHYVNRSFQLPYEFQERLVKL